MDRKYELTSETININGVILHRIKALRDFCDVKSGDLGGWIESENNLSQVDNCWVYENAQVCGDARVSEDAQIYGFAQISKNARVTGDARVYESAQVTGHARVFRYARVYGNAYVAGECKVYGTAQILEDSRVYGNAHIHGEAHIYGIAHVYYGDHASDISTPQPIRVGDVWLGSIDLGIDLGLDCKSIKIGSVVTLKSGGSEMTVMAIDGDKCTCVHYNLELHTIELPQECLILKS